MASSSSYRLLQIALAVFGTVMIVLHPLAVQSFGGHHMGHLWGDVPALLLVAIVLSVLFPASGLSSRESVRD